MWMTLERFHDKVIIMVIGATKLSDIFGFRDHHHIGEFPRLWIKVDGRNSVPRQGEFWKQLWLQEIGVGM